jgi:hypothetical protein
MTPQTLPRDLGDFPGHVGSVSDRRSKTRRRTVAVAALPDRHAMFHIPPHGVCGYGIGDHVCGWRNWESSIGERTVKLTLTMDINRSSLPSAWCTSCNQTRPANEFPQKRDGLPYKTCLRCRVCPTSQFVKSCSNCCCI